MGQKNPLAKCQHLGKAPTGMLGPLGKWEPALVLDVTKPYKFIGFGAMDVTKPYKFIGFGAMTWRPT